MPLNPNIPVITSRNYQKFVSPTIGGEKKSHGLKPRNFKKNPQGCYAHAASFPDELLIPESEWPARLAEQQANKSSLLNMRELYNIRSLDQDGYGYCWAFSSTKAVMYVRLREGSPQVELSAWAVAAIIKNYRDQGGWGAESMQWIIENGVPSLEVWPQGKVQKSLDTSAMRADAAKRKITEWWDGPDGGTKAKQVLVSCLLRGWPCVTDFNWWSHSVCAIAVKSISPFQIVIDNSWGPSAGDNGLYVLEGSKAVPDGLVIPRVSRAG